MFEAPTPKLISTKKEMRFGEGEKKTNLFNVFHFGFRLKYFTFYIAIYFLNYEGNVLFIM